jgi:hypothetical protein
MTAFRWLDHFAETLIWVPRLVLLFSLAALLYYASDRQAPYEVISNDAAEGRPGERVVLHARVRRDMSRSCEVRLSRQIVDATGVVHSSDDAHLSAVALAELEARSPGKAHIAIDIPANAASGPAVLLTSRHYVCNKVHRLWPITHTTAMPFMVLPRS